jgi:hypothetical protein
LTYSPNSNEAKILRPHYQKICEKVNAIMSQNGTCTHIKVTGVRCGSPALKGEQFCYFHQNAIRSVRRPKQSRLHPIALIEDEESIQYALMEVINALMKNTIDLKRATLILRALHIAVKNAGRVKFALQGKNAVSQVPDFAPPPLETDFDEVTEIDLPYNAWVPQKSERQIMEEKARAQKLHDWQAQQAQIRANLERARVSLQKPRAAVPAESHEATAPSTVQAKPKASASVGTDAFARPVREATVPSPAKTTPADAAQNSNTTAPNPTTIPSHNFSNNPLPTPHPTATHSAARKPPQPTTASTPKERKKAQAAKHA